ncbi:hypothetical protein HT206_002454 [Salmonella enterica]|nr:hypothetical protein [Salmonella enterica]
MWERKKIAIPPDAQAITCSQAVVHPWDMATGYATSDGCYLSPPNAIAALSGKLSGISGQQNIIVIMLCDSTLTGFSAQLSELANVLPFPELTQVARCAATRITQAINRMQIPATPQDGLKPPQPLNVSTLTRSINLNNAISAMQSGGVGDISALRQTLAGFQQQRRQQLQQMTDTLTGRKATTTAWTFISQGDIVKGAADMLKNIPRPEATLTYAHLFTGDIPSMTHWFKEVTP